MKKAFLMILLLVVFLYGCERGGTPSQPVAYVGGTNGLDIEFVEDSPPDEVLDDRQDAFPIMLSLTNQGEYTIKERDILATLSGISKDAFDLSSLHVRNDAPLQRVIKGEMPEGDQIIMDFGEASYEEDLSADFKTTIRADVCYRYRTVAASSLCLKKNVVQHRTRDVCLVRNEDIYVENSGAPIQVTSVSEKPAGTNKVSFTFTIEKKAEGDVYEKDLFKDSCSEHENDEGKVNVKITSPSSKIKAKCGVFDDKDEGVIRLINDKRSVTCTIDTKNLQETAYKGRVNIMVDYTFRSAVAQEIIVKNAVVV